LRRPRRPLEQHRVAELVGLRRAHAVPWCALGPGTVELGGLLIACLAAILSPIRVITWAGVPMDDECCL